MCLYIKNWYNRMENKELPTVVNPNEELEKKLLEETDINNIKNIIDLFNLNIQKKNIVRTNKLNELQDKVCDQIDKRLTTNADTFSNKDLIDYFKAIQDTINKSEISSEDITSPKIELNQNNVNINMGPVLSRDSRQNVLDAVKRILESQVVDNTKEVEPNE